ncbi:unnamed protein product, partial [Iphiclides podalirius]
MSGRKRRRSMARRMPTDLWTSPSVVSGYKKSSQLAISAGSECARTRDGVPAAGPITSPIGQRAMVNWRDSRRLAPGVFASTLPCINYRSPDERAHRTKVTTRFQHAPLCAITNG